MGFRFVVDSISHQNRRVIFVGGRILKFDLIGVFGYGHFGQREVFQFALGVVNLCIDFPSARLTHNGRSPSAYCLARVYFIARMCPFQL